MADEQAETTEFPEDLTNIRELMKFMLCKKSEENLEPDWYDKVMCSLVASEVAGSDLNAPLIAAIMIAVAEIRTEISLLTDLLSDKLPDEHQVSDIAAALKIIAEHMPNN